MSPRVPVMAPFDEHNRALVDNVHPPEWVNPQPLAQYNLVVIGAGTAGLVSAAGAAALGAKVALVERQFLGGDCLNYGCVPSKAIIRAARVAQTVREASEYGVHVSGGFTINFDEAMQRMRRLRANISAHDSAQRFSDLGVDVFLGEGRFRDRGTVEVDGQTLRFSRAIIATGTRAVHPAIPGLAEAGFLTNETVFSLTELPRRLCVIGAGPIGCELAQAFSRLGSEVCVITHGAAILSKEDREVAAIIQRRFEHEGIKVISGAQILKVEVLDGSRYLTFERDGRVEVTVADEILAAVGRSPNVEGLGLEAAGVAYDTKGITVDDRLRTTNSRIYAAGDICSRFKFTHAADALARLALRNALFFGRGKASLLVIPWCTFTDPEVAHVGISENEARKQGYVVTHTLSMKEVDRAVLDGTTDGFARVHMDARSSRILGATLVSEHAGESISEFVLGMTQRVPLSALSSVIHPYPTQAEAIKRLGDLSMRARLKPWLYKVFAAYFETRR